MGKSTLNERKIVVNWLRNNRLFIKDNKVVDGLEDLKLAELEASLEYCLLWKKHISEMYDSVYAESRFLEDARYYYRKSRLAMFRGSGVDCKEVGFWEHQEMKRLHDTNTEVKNCYGSYGNQFWDEYLSIKVNNKRFKFYLTEKHLDMLKRMDEINKLSKQAVKMLSTLREQIIEKKAIDQLENKRIMEEMKKAEVKPGATK